MYMFSSLSYHQETTVGLYISAHILSRLQYYDGHNKGGEGTKVGE